MNAMGTKAAVCAMLMGTIGAAYAANPHFIGKVTATIDNGSGAAQLCFTTSRSCCQASAITV